MIGQTISHYKIIEKLGEGGMGIVYKAQDMKLDRLVALKFLPPHLAADEQGKKRFIHEAKAASSLDHPNICNVHEIDETPDGQVFIVMAIYAGTPLNKKIEQGPLKIEEALDVVIQAAEGLQAAHEKSIVHRDVKSSNIMVTEKGRAVMMDFGLARASGATKLTKAGSTVGTVHYMSPEQAKGEEADHRTDIWSLGTVLYEMVAGRLPFKSEYTDAVVYSIINQEPEPLTNVRSNVPMEVERIVKKAMQKKVADRYQHVDDLLTDLRTVQKEFKEGIAERRPREMKKTLLRRLLLAGSALVVAAVLAVAGLFIFREESEQIKSLAVLPLDNLSGNPEQEYFVDGMTEALITELSKISALKVISRTSAMQYKGVKRPLPQIARELGVMGLIEGSVLREGDQVRITAQLIHGATDKHLWAESYQRELRGILALQSEVARAIADEVRIQLTMQETARLSSLPRVNPEAHDAYLRGRFYWNKGEREDLEKARVYFEQALEMDSRYAPAYVGLADYYSVLPFYTNASPNDVFPKAKQAVTKALELDGSLAEAHGTLAYILTYYDWQWAAAEREFQRALALNPNDATLRHRYSRYLSSLGRVEEALAEIERARALDPLSLVIKANVGVIYYFARQYDRAIEELQKVLSEHPEFSVAHWGLGLAYEQKATYDSAMAEMEKAAERRGTNALASLGHVYAVTARKKQAREILTELRMRTEQQNVSGYQIALVHVGLGEPEPAMAALQQAYQERSTLLGYLKMDPRLDPLRDDPRFRELLKKIGLEK